ncbi:helix-turn-helix domain-containing protein [Salicibibacter cibi]|uniref:Helix-turn-helix domain-containing protein n=1 Tax=Salicibibacter cibi TaxID=2743001 RepID=A0A7T6Z872_9BACI|nr:helix-turn-helix domain-containing protein [Salicibibacter cibi]QQK78751.1 helix-turn-helix domain-containing protein [Salicibibacter cibi]
MDLADPYIQKLILELNTAARVHLSKMNINSEYYSVKDVAELFDVNKQTVYKWIAEEKIDYSIDNSPGKTLRKGYRIPKRQFHGKRHASH